MSEAVTSNFYAMVEQAWGLCDASKEYAKTAGRDVPPQEMMEKVFMTSDLVDIARTQKEWGNPPKVFLKSPYGLQYRPEHNNWVPFRHGPLTV